MSNAMSSQPSLRWNLLCLMSLAACSSASTHGALSDGGAVQEGDAGGDLTSAATHPPMDAGHRHDGATAMLGLDASARPDGSMDAPPVLDGSMAPDGDAHADGAVFADATLPTDASHAQDADASGTNPADAGCPTGYAPDGHGGCSNIDDCPGNQCLRGLCVDGVNSYSCDCTGTGYTGTRCEIPVSTCGTPNLCTSNAYPCVPTMSPGYTCLGQFADWPMPDPEAGAAHAPSYDTSTAGIVVDEVTGLTWQREIPALYKGCTLKVHDTGDSCAWSEAVHFCDQLVLNGQSDWRLPSKVELESILNETKYNPALDMTVWPAPSSASGVFGNLWTSSPYSGGGGAYWAVDFVDGWSVTNAASVGNRVRCVRGLPTGTSTPDQRYQVDLGADTVTDAVTGLVWQRTVSATARAFADAGTQCPSGFRLPALKELLTLVDPRRKGPALDPTFPTSTQASDWFWTSSTDPNPFGHGNYAYAVSFYDGLTTSYRKTELHYVRCVR